MLILGGAQQQPFFIHCSACWPYLIELASYRRELKTGKKARKRRSAGCGRFPDGQFGAANDPARIDEQLEILYDRGQAKHQADLAAKEKVVKTILILLAF